ncbi:MAG: hypothetical protein C0606_09955 [Hyphomicrobiales bacterium]|nr:MAG: hypothetical protein C0606_09955 [Hyphomicrobiales bacterium]
MRRLPRRALSPTIPPRPATMRTARRTRLWLRRRSSSRRRRRRLLTPTATWRPRPRAPRLLATAMRRPLAKTTTRKRLPRPRPRKQPWSARSVRLRLSRGLTQLT